MTLRAQLDRLAVEQLLRAWAACISPVTGRA